MNHYINVKSSFTQNQQIRINAEKKILLKLFTYICIYIYKQEDVDYYYVVNFSSIQYFVYVNESGG